MAFSGRTGHRTDAVFQRYNITDDADKRDAARKVADYRAKKAAATKVAVFPRVGSA
jgi:hypothetical protein